MSVLSKTEHPHVCRNDRGRPVVGKAEVKLGVIAAYWNLGWTLEQLEQNYPWLTRAEILDALSFYEDHREEIDLLIEQNRPPISCRRMASTPSPPATAVFSVQTTPTS
jgi:uncharacterized protein (DUF433 family)